MQSVRDDIQSIGSRLVSIEERLSASDIRVERMEDIQIGLSNELNVMKADLEKFRSELQSQGKGIGSNASAQASTSGGFRSQTAVFGGLASLGSFQAASQWV